MKLDMPSTKKGLQRLWNHAAHQLNHHYPSRSCSTIFGSLPVDYASDDDVEKYDVLWCIYLLSLGYFSRQSNLLIKLSDPQQLCLSKFPSSIKIENNGCKYFRHGQGFRLRVSFENFVSCFKLSSVLLSVFGFPPSLSESSRVLSLPFPELGYGEAGRLFLVFPDDRDLWVLFSSNVTPMLNLLNRRSA